MGTITSLRGAGASPLHLFYFLAFFLALSFSLSACLPRENEAPVTPRPDTTSPTRSASPTAPIVEQTAPPPGSPTPELALRLDSTSESIRQKMLQSASAWQSLWLDSQTIDSSGNLIREQLWIDQPAARFRLLRGVPQSQPDLLKLSDGLTVLETNLKTGQRQTFPLPPQIAGAYLPQLTPGLVYPNPIGAQLGSMTAHLVFSSDFAQGNGFFTPIRIEQTIGRETLVAEWTFAANAAPSWRIWIDVDTGILLKLQDFGKSGGQAVQFETSVTALQFDPTLPAELFNLEFPASAQFVDSPGLISLPTALPSTPGSPDHVGQVMFFSFNPGNSSARLLQLPASCISAQQPCPTPVAIRLPAPTFASQPFTMVWMRDGSRAVYIGNLADQPSQLYLFDAQSGEFTLLAEFPYIEMPSWDKAGDWISFRAHDAQGNTDTYIIRPDGTNLARVTASPNLPVESRPYGVDGWIGNNIIVRSLRPASDGPVYLVRADDLRVRTLFDTPFTKASFHPSPDGSLLAFDDYDYQSARHTFRVIAPDGAGLRDLADFQTTLYPIVWAADNFTLAFAVYPVFDTAPTLVYVITRDGRGLRQVYAADGIRSMAFSPDAKTLLIEDGGLNTIIVVNIQTLKATPLQTLAPLPGEWLTQPVWLP